MIFKESVTTPLAIWYTSNFSKSNIIAKSPFPAQFRSNAERGGFEPPVRFYPYDSLANCWFKPLTHLSRCRIASFKGSANINVAFKLSQLGLNKFMGRQIITGRQILFYVCLLFARPILKRRV